METVALVVLLILAVALIGVVLLQRNEGGGLGMGAGGVMTGRAQATALARATWWIGGAFMVVSLAMTVIAARDAAGTSVVDQINPAANDEAPADATAPAVPDLGAGGSLLPPPAGGEAPAEGTAPATDAPLVPSGD
ncbi:Preprotein translocase subunit SecG [Rubellimicrobium mesophilum DSM 19309]|uniref:Protein-export membrane protein SecG n=1 Tax=Rubellimicrobium mesophilum DSM 19309 TaxID=442562 RepID=A0A017HE97_9RHOB|nr:preprotein translocase subunit SecG [Rubellimicrobium mesophilum]EYD72094.1 Preprotein translocase subunit SecG [Rubellimicrobium mesophilum DSM 19309]